MVVTPPAFCRAIGHQCASVIPAGLHGRSAGREAHHRGRHRSIGVGAIVQLAVGVEAKAAKASVCEQHATVVRTGSHRSHAPWWRNDHHPGWRTDAPGLMQGLPSHESGHCRHFIVRLQHAGNCRGNQGAGRSPRPKYISSGVWPAKAELFRHCPSPYPRTGPNVAMLAWCTMRPDESMHPTPLYRTGSAAADTNRPPIKKSA